MLKNLPILLGALVLALATTAAARPDGATRERQVARKAGSGLGDLLRREIPADLPSLNDVFVTPPYIDRPGLCRVDRLVVNYVDGDRDRLQGLSAESFFRPIKGARSAQDCPARGRIDGGFFKADDGDLALRGYAMWNTLFDAIEAGKAAYPLRCTNSDGKTVEACTAEDMKRLKYMGYSEMADCSLRPPFTYEDRCIRFQSDRTVEVTWSFDRGILRVDVGPAPVFIQ